MRLIKYSAIAVMIVVVGMALGQSPFRLSEKEMKDLLKRIDKQAESFRGSLKSALNHSHLDHSKAEDRINDFVKAFEEAAEKLEHKFNDKNSASSEVEEVLRRAARIDDFMTRHQLSSRAESDWSSLRRNLDALAEAYNVSWSWDRPRLDDRR